MRQPTCVSGMFNKLKQILNLRVARPDSPSRRPQLPLSQFIEKTREFTGAVIALINIFC